MYVKENRMVWISTLVSMVILLSACISVSASPQLPCEFYGTVVISGTPAPVGTVITAYVNSVKQGSITVKDAGYYGGTDTFDERLIVLSGDNDFSGGAPTITFKIGEKTADQTSPYSPGMSSELTLSSGGGAVSPQSSTNNTPAPVQAMSGASPPQSSNQTTPVAPMVTAPPQVSVPAVVPAVQTTAPVQVLTNGPENVSSQLSITSAPVQAASVQPTQPSQPVLPPVSTPQSTPIPAPVLTVTPPVVQMPANVTQPAAPVVNTTPVPLATSMPVVMSNQTAPVNGTSSGTTGTNTSVTVSFPSGQIIGQ
jgi:hypothetical protein